jgi:hypothetical protein
MFGERSLTAKRNLLAYQTLRHCGFPQIRNIGHFYRPLFAPFFN